MGGGLFFFFLFFFLTLLPFPVDVGLPVNAPPQLGGGGWRRSVGGGGGELASKGAIERVFYGPTQVVMRARCPFSRHTSVTGH